MPYREVAKGQPLDYGIPMPEFKHDSLPVPCCAQPKGLSEIARPNGGLKGRPRFDSMAAVSLRPFRACGFLDTGTQAFVGPVGLRRPGLFLMALRAGTGGQ